MNQIRLWPSADRVAAIRPTVTRVGDTYRLGYDPRDARIVGLTALWLITLVFVAWALAGAALAGKTEAMIMLGVVAPIVALASRPLLKFWTYDTVEVEWGWLMIRRRYGPFGPRTILAAHDITDIRYRHGATADARWPADPDHPDGLHLVVERVPSIWIATPSRQIQIGYQLDRADAQPMIDALRARFGHAPRAITSRA